jgi:transposase
VRGDRTVAELASHFGVHATLVQAWKKQLLAGAEVVFAPGHRIADPTAEAKQAELYEQLGRAQMELAWLKKKVSRLD